MAVCDWIAPAPILISCVSAVLLRTVNRNSVHLTIDDMVTVTGLHGYGVLPHVIRELTSQDNTNVLSTFGECDHDFHSLDGIACIMD